MRKIDVGILGATGIVGQRLILMLKEHPWFRLAALTASEDSAGKPFEEACHWKLPVPMPGSVRTMPVLESEPDVGCRLVFSAVSGSAAPEIERRFAEHGYGVVSNAGAFRMFPDVPLVIPEVNPGHLDIVRSQVFYREGQGGFIVTNPNCVTVPLAMALAPLHRMYGISSILVTTLQAVSGAGYPGNASMDILDNVIPYIQGEERKIETEINKILGDQGENVIKSAEIPVSAQVHRVAVQDGHMLAVSVKLREKASVDDVKACLAEYYKTNGRVELPAAPEQPLVILEESDRPQPRMDRNRGNGMTVTIGRIRGCPVLDIKMSILGHNTVRGAAGAALLNAELLYAKGLI
ncbi:aspartate-semialdehyde dehydrogenase [candidate division KSB1 bacterium]